MPSGRATRCTYVLVVAGIGKPATRADVAVNAIKRDACAIVVSKCNVPLFALPDTWLFLSVVGWPLCPPFSRRAPRTCRPQNCSLQLVAISIPRQHCQLGRTTICQLHADLPCGTQDAQRKKRRFCCMRQCRTDSPVAPLGLSDKPLHAKLIRPMRIQQFRNTNAAFAYDSVDARQRNLQL